MYVRDHSRRVFHAALDLDPTAYDFEVFRITAEIARQVFPVALDLDHPAFRAGLDRLFRITEAKAESRRRPGILGAVKRAGLTLAAGVTFARLFLLPPRQSELPKQVRLSPAW
jgi:magnesium-protoporphyrin IX monomethyl ester (oxidative) cyclase